MRELRYILLLLVVGLYASWQRSDMHAQAAATCPSASESSMPSVFHNTLEDYAKRLQQQYDWTDALTSYQIGASNEDNRLRTRRQERVSSSWQVRINIQDLHAALRYESNRIAHNINRIVALSRMTPLSLSKEKISFPFHSFW
ncbi:MAG: hypothetical protein IJ000_05205 [Paludibacteraceae bacterium]|nr:hypothetical protein [Paludibacteraceae bacterium]